MKKRKEPTLLLERRRSTNIAIALSRKASCAPCLARRAAPRRAALLPPSVGVVVARARSRARSLARALVPGRDTLGGRTTRVGLTVVAREGIAVAHTPTVVSSSVVTKIAA